MSKIIRPHGMHGEWTHPPREGGWQVPGAMRPFVTSFDHLFIMYAVSLHSKRNISWTTLAQNAPPCLLEIQTRPLLRLVLLLIRSTAFCAVWLQPDKNSLRDSIGRLVHYIQWRATASEALRSKPFSSRFCCLQLRTHALNRLQRHFTHSTINYNE